MLFYHYYLVDNYTEKDFDTKTQFYVQTRLLKTIIFKLKMYTGKITST